MEKAKFINTSIEERLNETGFVVVKSFLNHNHIAALKQLFDHLSIQDCQNQLWFSNVDLNYSESEKVSTRIEQIIGTELKRHIEDFRVDLYSMCYKNSSSSFLNPHRDYAITDESCFEYRNVWIPLVDVNQENGGLFVIPFSHKCIDSISIPGEALCNDFFIEVLKPFMYPVNVKAGDMVVYKEKTFHGSFENYSNQKRPNIHFGLLQKDTQLLYYKPLTEHVYQRYKAQASDLLTGKIDTCVEQKLYYDTYNRNPNKIEELQKMIRCLSQHSV